MDWAVRGFDPVTLVDVREGRIVSGVKGIPIGTDYSKGTYYVASSGAILLRSPDVTGGEVQVAPSVAAFVKFEPREPEAEEE